jgi:thermitase
MLVLALIALPSDKKVSAEKRNIPRFAEDHFILKLKRSPDVMAASISSHSGDVYHKRIVNLLRSIDIAENGIRMLYPFDSRDRNDLYTKYEFDTYYIIDVNSGAEIQEICKMLSENNEVDFAEPDFIGESAGKKSIVSPPNDEYFNRQWGLYNDGSLRTTTGKHGKKGADMNVLKAWEINRGSEEVIVAILDSGTKPDHPDLTGRIWSNRDEVKNGRDDDGNGFVDDLNGYNFAYDNPNIRDDGGHGTNICGTVGATTNNATGYAGIDQACRLMICKNLDDDNLGEYSWWAASLYYAANNGARIINMSEGGYDYSKTLENAIDYAFDSGCLIVASMMNKNNGDTYYPASFKNVLAVGATDTDDSRCREFTWGGGSNWGMHISVVAPGNKIYGLDFKDNFNYDIYWSGTSQATAYVSGIASVLLSQDPNRTNSELKEIITSTAIDLIGDPREDRKGWDQYYGYGRVDLYDALNYGKFPSGKKETKVNDEILEDPFNDDPDSNSIRAKANDSKDKDKVIKNRAKKPKADDR